MQEFLKKGIAKIKLVLESGGKHLWGKKKSLSLEHRNPQPLFLIPLILWDSFAKD